MQDFGEFFFKPSGCTGCTLKTGGCYRNLVMGTSRATSLLTRAGYRNKHFLAAKILPNLSPKLWAIFVAKKSLMASKSSPIGKILPDLVTLSIGMELFSSTKELHGNR